MTLTAFRISDGKGGLVTYELSEIDRTEGTRISTHGRQGACGRCGKAIGYQDLRVAHPTAGHLCLTCAVALGALVKVTDG